MSFKDPFVYNISNAEVFGRVSSINDYYVELPKTKDRTAYWTKNTILPSGNIYFNTEITSSITWLKITDQNLLSSNTTIYGVQSNNILSSDINFYMDNCSFKNFAIGASNSILYGAINTIFKNCSCTGTGILGFNDGKNNDITCNVYNCSCTGTTGWLLTTLYRNNRANPSEINSMKFFIKDTTFLIDKNAYIGIFANSTKQANQPTDTNYCHVKQLDIELNNCIKVGQGSTFNPIYCGGYCADTYNSNNNVSMYIDNINVLINGGSYFIEAYDGALPNGNGIYLGNWTNNNGKTVIGNINCIVNSGNFYNLYGGPAVQGNGTAIVTGETHIYINGGTFASVCGMGSRTTGEGTQSITTTGPIYIHLLSGDIGIVCPAMRHAGYDVISGDGSESCQDSYVILSDNYNWNNTEFRACLLHNDDAFRQSNLIFDNYTGNLISGSIIGFENIEVQNNSTVTLTDVYLHNNNPWILDLTHRSIDKSELPLITIDYGQSDIDNSLIKLTLKLNDNNTLSSFNLVKLIDTIFSITIDRFIDYTMDIYYNDQLLCTLNLNQLVADLDSKIYIENTGSIFDGYYINTNEENNILIFNKP